MNKRKPKQLGPGSRVAIISQSSAGPSLFPGIYEKGLEVLMSCLGLIPVEFPTARMEPEKLYKRPDLRAEDINKAFKREDIDGIISTIGGDDSVRVLPYIDTELIKNNPKFIMGYSDMTTLLAYFSYLGNVVFYGPCVMAGIAQIENLGEDYKSHIQEILFSQKSEITLKPYYRYSEGYPDWTINENLGKIHTPINDEGWDWLQGSKDVEGTFWGGCVEVLEFMKGTKFWPESPFFKNKFLILETSEEVLSPTQVKRILRNYGMQGILANISGLVIGRPCGYTKEMKKELREVISEIVIEEFGCTEIPIILNFDIGHTDPQLVIPFGVPSQISSKDQSVKLIETIFDWKKQ